MRNLIPAMAINLYSVSCLWAYRISGYFMLNLFEDPALLALAFA